MTVLAQPTTGTRSQSRSQRYWEIDTLRGVAIVMMIIFHLMWDLWFFRVTPDIVLYAGFWKYFQRTCACLFIFLAGVSLTVSYRRVLAAGLSEAQIARKFFLRGLRIFAWGMVITAVVYFAGVGYVDFGVLHLIGFSIAAGYFFLRQRWLNLLLWLAFNIAGFFLLQTYVDVRWLAWLGFKPQFYYPVDYFPIIPWFGVFLLGIWAGNTFYTSEGRLIPLPDLSGWLPVRWLQWLGQHSLTIYLLHQLILFGLLFAILYALGRVTL